MWGKRHGGEKQQRRAWRRRWWQFQWARGQRLREESNRIGIPRVLLGDNLAKSRAMRLANAYTEGPNVWHLHRLLSVPQIDLSARADRKMVIFYVYLRYFTKKSRLYRTDTQIKKNS